MNIYPAAVRCVYSRDFEIMDEVIIGNVTYPTVSPTDGTLVFDAHFESGNLGRVDVISECEYDLFIRPDTCNSKYRVWFYFECCNAVENQRVIFNVVNFSKQKSLFETGVGAPVFAYCIPYTYTKLQRWLGGIERRKLPYVQRDVLCLSVQRRRVDVLTICSDVFCLDRRRIVVLTARVHPGETPSSYVIHGLIEFLISSDPKAVELRNEFCFKIIPMLNPDGVFLGNYRCSVLGFDLNRMWRRPVEWSHPSIHATKQLLTHFNDNPQTPVSIYIDLHAHSQKTNSFLYGNVNEGETSDRQLWLPHLMAELADDFSLELTQFNTSQDKEGTGRRTMGDLLSTLCYTMEVSFFCYRPSDSTVTSTVPYLQFKYEALGEALALSILEHRRVEEGTRTISLSRKYLTFVSKKPQKTFKEFPKLSEAAESLEMLKQPQVISIRGHNEFHFQAGSVMKNAKILLKE